MFKKKTVAKVKMFWFRLKYQRTNNVFRGLKLLETTLISHLLQTRGHNKPLNTTSYTRAIQFQP